MKKCLDNVTIKVELFDRSNAPEGSTLTDNRWVKYVNEEMNKVGINVEFVAVPRADEVTKMQTMMSSGTAPDMLQLIPMLMRKITGIRAVSGI